MAEDGKDAVSAVQLRFSFSVSVRNGCSALVRSVRPVPLVAVGRSFNPLTPPPSLSLPLSQVVEGSCRIPEAGLLENRVAKREGSRRRRHRRLQMSERRHENHFRRRRITRARTAQGRTNLAGCRFCLCRRSPFHCITGVLLPYADARLPILYRNSSHLSLSLTKYRSCCIGCQHFLSLRDWVLDEGEGALLRM